MYTYGVCLQEPMLHLYVSIYCIRAFVLHLDVSVFKSFCTWACMPRRACVRQQELLCCNWMCPSSRACAALLRVCHSVYKSYLYMLHLDVSIYKKPALDVVSTSVRNTEKNEKMKQRKQSEADRVPSDNFRFEPKIFYVCFYSTPYIGLSPLKVIL